MPVLLDQLGRRYGCRPSALLKGSWEDLLVDVTCYLDGLSAQDAIVRSLAAKETPIFPVAVCIS